MVFIHSWSCRSTSLSSRSHHFYLSSRLHGKFRVSCYGVPGLVKPPGEWKFFVGLFVQELKSILTFCLVRLLLSESLIKFCLFAESVGILAFVSGSMLYDHVVSFQTHDPTTNIALVHRVVLHPGKSMSFCTQLERSTS